MKKSDVKTFFLLGKKAFGLPSQYSWDWSISKIKQYLQSSFGFGIVCFDQNTIIGFVLAQKKYSSQKPQVAWINYVFVEKKYRKKCIGSILLQQALTTLKKLGKTDIIADAYTNNKRSLQFFKANKFRIKEKWVILSRKLM